jgi:2-desacetyl-2-hydroxyethyl bacteriochlorophyllide A dehydrogenase
MKAVVKADPGKGVRIQEVPIPYVGPHDILVGVTASGICGSDISISLWKEGYHHIPLPMILGHEFSGKVVCNGPEVGGIEEGDRVTVNPVLPCGQCRPCQIGSKRDCEKKDILGFTKNGSFAPFVSVPERASVFKLPDRLSDEMGALIEPFAVAYHAIELSRFQAADRVAVLGMGTIGLMTVGLLGALGARLIVMIGRSLREDRIGIAKEMGADLILDIRRDDPVKVAKEVTDERCFDIVFEATGNPSSLPYGLGMLRRGGEMVLSGIFEGKGEIDLTEFVRGSKRIIGNHAYEDTTWGKVIEILSKGSIPTRRLITHELPLSDGQEAFDLVIRREGVKVLLRP